MLPIPEGSREQLALSMSDSELAGQKRFTFISTHLDHSSSSVRTIQAQAINDVLAENPLPLIIAGDFNARPDGPEIKQGMNEYLQLCQDDFTIPSDNPNSKIDYIFYKPACNWKKKGCFYPSNLFIRSLTSNSSG